MRLSLWCLQLIDVKKEDYFDIEGIESLQWILLLIKNKSNSNTRNIVYIYTVRYFLRLALSIFSFYWESNNKYYHSNGN